MLLLVQYTLTFASVLILVALGGCFSEHSGVINLGLEGVMIMGALGGALVMRYLSPTVPAIVMILAVVLISMLFGVIYSALLAVACINFKADQTIVGTALNMLGLAASTVIVKAINISANPDDVSSIIQYGPAKKLFLVNIGGFEFSWFMLITLLLLIASYITLYKTRFGLRLMACGEHPQAADSVGINVYKMRWAGVLISGMLGGLGGIVFITAGVSEWRFGVHHPVRLQLEFRGRRFRSGLPRAGGYDLRPVEAPAHRAGGAAVRYVPRALERLYRHRLPRGDEHSERRVQHDALHHLAGGAGLHVQEVPCPQGGGYPLRQGAEITS